MLTASALRVGASDTGGTMAIRVLVDGVGAKEAVEELVSCAGIVGRAEAVPQGSDDKDLVVLTAAATIIGAAGGVTTIIDTMLRWRDRLAKSRETLPRIVIVVGEQRRTLSNLRRDELTDLLEGDPDPDELIV